VGALPYLPDVLARGAAFRNLPGSGDRARGKVGPDGSATAAVPYVTLDDPNPRAGSATLVSYGGDSDWQDVHPFRFALEEGDGPPLWNSAERLLTVYLPKGTSKTVLMSSYLHPEDLKLMGVWQWIREGIEVGTVFLPGQQHLIPGSDSERVAHILQRAVEGALMLTPALASLVHAVQQPVGIPEFVPLTVRRADLGRDARPAAHDAEVDLTDWGGDGRRDVCGAGCMAPMPGCWAAFGCTAPALPR
jgi:hypothetical protein